MDPKAFIDNFRDVVTKHYADFQGRARRQVFWYYFLVYVIIFCVLWVIESLLGVMFLTTLLGLALLLPNLGVTVRRLHDTDRSGWWVLIGFVPVLLAFLLMFTAVLGGSLGGVFLFGTLIPIVALAALGVLIYFCAQPGTVGPNKYGPDPKAGGM